MERRRHRTGRTCQVPCYPGNLMEYGYQDLDPGLKVQFPFNGIRFDKLSTAVTPVRAHSEKYEKDSDAIVTFLTQYVSKRAPKPSVKIVSVGQVRPAKRQKTSASHDTFKEKIELKKYSREEYLMSMAQHQQLYEVWKTAGLIKSKKTPESSKAFEARVVVLEAKTYKSSHQSLFADEKPKANNRNNPALDRKGSITIQSHADT